MAQNLLYFKETMNRTIFQFLFCLLGLAIIGCNGSYSGQVFLDLNGNGKKELSEEGVSGVVVTVTRDGEQIGAIITGVDGSFSLKNNEMGAEVCFKVEESFGRDKIATQVLPRAVTKSVEENISSQLSKGNLFAEDEGDAKEESSGVEDADEDKKESSESDNEDDDTVSELELESQVIAHKVSCDRSGAINLQMNVPISVDYDKSIASAPKIETKKLKPGELFEFLVYFPSTCNLLELNLPKFIVRQGGGAGQDVSTGINQVNFNIGEQPRRVLSSSQLTQDDVSRKRVWLRAVDDVPPGEHKVKITPQVICPGDKTFALDTQVWEIKGEDPIKVKLMDARTTDNSPALGMDFPFKVEIVNQHFEDVGEIEVNVTAEGMTILPNSILPLVVREQDCSPKLSKMKCIPYLPVGGTWVFNATAKLPEKLNEDREFKFVIEVVLKDFEKTYKDEMSFFMPGDNPKN